MIIAPEDRSEMQVKLTVFKITKTLRQMANNKDH